MSKNMIEEALYMLTQKVTLEILKSVESLEFKYSERNLDIPVIQGEKSLLCLALYCLIAIRICGHEGVDHK